MIWAASRGLHFQRQLGENQDFRFNEYFMWQIMPAFLKRRNSPIFPSNLAFKAGWWLPSFSAVNTALFVGRCHRRWDCIVQQVLIQMYCKSPCLACSPQNRIFLYPGLSSPVPFVRSSKVTSSASAPQVCESIAYGGIISSPTNSLARLNSPVSLCSKRRIASHKIWREQAVGMGFGRGRLGRETHLAIKVSDYTGKAKPLNHTEELYLKARLFKTRIVRTRFTRRADCTAQIVAR